MLTPILATEDPYHAAAVFVRAAWPLVFETPADSDDPLACVGLAGARPMQAWLRVRARNISAADYGVL